jgi:hypothetical protein
MNIDPRSTGHFTKVLEEKGAIVRKGVSINSMFTNVCVHTRFNLEKTHIDITTVGDDDDLNEVPYNVNRHGQAFSQKDVLSTLVDLTKDAPNNVILSRDVLVSMVKKYSLFIYVENETKKFDMNIGVFNEP